MYDMMVMCYSANTKYVTSLLIGGVQSSFFLKVGQGISSCKSIVLMNDLEISITLQSKNCF